MKDEAVPTQEKDSVKVQVEADAAENLRVSTSVAKQSEVTERKIDDPEKKSQSIEGLQSSKAMVPDSTNNTGVTARKIERATTSDPRQSELTPSSGGNVSLSRDTADAKSAPDSNAAAVGVAPAGERAASRVVESQSSSTIQRSKSTVTAGGAKGTGTAALMPAPQTGTPRAGGGSLVRSSTGTEVPQLGDEGASAVPAAGTGKEAQAAGTDVSQIAVPNTKGSKSNSTDVLSNGPSSTRTERATTGLSSRISGAAKNSSPADLATSQPSSIRSNVRSDGVVRSLEPSARLGMGKDDGSGATSDLTTARTGADVRIPEGAERAEQSGVLVIAGPQAEASVASKLAGPRSTGSPRRKASLPGVSGGPSVAPPTSASAASPGRLTGTALRPRTGDERPKLDRDQTIGGLIKQSIPGIGASPDARISASLSLRKADSRKEAARILGGSEESEQAVERGLVWMAKHQFADGHWSVHEFPCQDHTCSGHGSFQSDTAATGLALLAFLGAGYTHLSGPHQDTVDRGIKWLIANQKPDGDLFVGNAEFVWFYSHGMATITMCEAFGMTKDPALQLPAQRALNF
ncbi:MAG: hypothetical protein FJ267_09060, partial [Planctomycetes bacterium]|nr:hypothetical protein [Planctomycetota bacterium]